MRFSFLIALFVICYSESEDALAAAAVLDPVTISSCKASSKFSNENGCEKTYDGKSFEWATKGEGVGSWIDFTFEKEYVLTEMVYTNRGPGEANKQIQLQFSDGATEVVNLALGKTTTKIQYSKAVKSVRLTVTKAYGTINNGAREIQFFTPHEEPVCKPEKLATLKENNFHRPGPGVHFPITKTITYTLFNGYTCDVTGWNYFLDYAKGVAINTVSKPQALVKGLEPNKAYKYAIYQYASSFAGTNGFQAPGAIEIDTKQFVSDEPTASGTFMSDAKGEALFRFRKKSTHVHLSGIAIAKICADVPACKPNEATAISGKVCKCNGNECAVGKFCYDSTCNDKEKVPACTPNEATAISGKVCKCNGNECAIAKFCYDSTCNDKEKVPACTPNEATSISGKACKCNGSECAVAKFCYDSTCNDKEKVPACTPNGATAISGKTCKCNGSECAVGKFCYDSTCNDEKSKTCTADAYQAIAGDACHCAAETTTCAIGKFCYSSGCKKSGCTVRENVDTEFFFGAKLAGSWDSTKREMSLALPIPGDVKVTKIEWIKAQDKSLSYDPTDSKTLWSVDDSDICNPEFDLAISQKKFFGKGSRFSLTGKRMATYLKIVSEERIHINIDGVKYSYMRKMENTVPLMVNLIQKNIIRAHFNTIFSSQTTLEINILFSSITDVAAFLKECNAKFKPFGVTCTGIKAKVADRLRRVLKVGNLVIVFGGTQKNIQIVINSIKTNKYKTPSFGPYNAVTKAELHHEFVFVTSAKESTSGPKTIELEMQVHSRVCVDHSLPGGGVKVTEVGGKKIDETISATSFSWTKNDAGDMITKTENNLCVETVTWLFAPKGYEAGAYDIPLEFTMAKSYGAFISMARVNVKQADVLGDIGFGTIESLYSDAACTKPATKFALGTKFYIKIGITNNPVDAASIDCTKLAVTQTAPDGTKKLTDMKETKYNFYQAKSKRNEVICGAELIQEGTHFHVKHDGYQTDLQVDITVKYTQGEQKDVTVRRRLISYEPELALGYENEYRAPDETTIGLTFEIVPAPESAVGKMIKMAENTTGSSRQSIMALGLGFVAIISIYFIKNFGTKKDEETFYLLQDTP